jgi:hypothetical protein
MPIVIEIEGVKYTWDPTKSTPDWPYPVPEMDEVVERSEFCITHATQE